MVRTLIRIFEILVVSFVLLCGHNECKAFVNYHDWEGDVDSNWNNANNWENNTLPATNQEARIGTSIYTFEPILSASSSFKPRYIRVGNKATLVINDRLECSREIRIESGATITVNSGGFLGNTDNGREMVISDNNTRVNVNGGTVNIQDHLFLDGNANGIGSDPTLNVTAGVVTVGDDLRFEGNADEEPNLSITGGSVTIFDRSYRNGADVNISISSTGSLIIGGDLTLSDADDIFTMTDGTLFLSSNSGTIDNSGTLSFSGGTINFTGNYVIQGSGTYIFNNIIISGADSVSQTTPSMYVAGNWSNSGIFTPNSNKVVFNGLSNQVISSSGSQTFYDLQLSGSGVKLMRAPLMINNDLTLDNNVTLDVNDTTNNQLNTKGNLIVNGSLDLRKAELLLNGASPQSIDGSFSMYDVTINNSMGVTLNSGALTLQRAMDISGGSVLATNGNLTFLSDSNETAYLKELTTGNSIQGNVTVERYLNESSGNWWYMLGSPVTGSTLADWNNELYMSGFTGTNSPGGAVSVYRYDENSILSGQTYETGYVAATNTSNALNSSEGWMVWATGSPFTIDVIGPLTTGQVQTGTLSYNSVISGTQDKKGWHLRSNPYASPVSWNNVSKSGMTDGEAYVSKPDGNYWGVNTDGINNLYSGEAFWVRVGSAGGSLTFNENDKVVDTDDYNSRLANPLKYKHPLRMELTYNNNPSYIDYSVLRFGGDSNSVNFDYVEGEAVKISNSYGIYPNIASISPQDSIKVYYNNLNPNDAAMIIPLNIWKYYPQSKLETYTIDFKGIEEWNKNNHCLILSDSNSNYSAKLDSSNHNYSWTIFDTVQSTYLYLNHSSPIFFDQDNISCFNENNGKLYAKGSKSLNGKHDYTWYNSNGTIIKSDSGFSGQSTIDQLVPGIYQVEVSNNGQCGIMRKTFELLNPDPVIARFEIPLVEDLSGDSIEYENMSSNAIRFEWKFGDGNTSLEFEPKHKYAAVGIYEVELKSIQTDNCFDLTSRIIEVKTYTGIEEEIRKQNTIVYGYGEDVYLKAIFYEDVNVEMSIFNMMGQSIYFEKFNDVKTLNERIPLHDKKGIYFVNLRIGESIKTFKVLIN